MIRRIVPTLILLASTVGSSACGGLTVPSGAAESGLDGAADAEDGSVWWIDGSIPPDVGATWDGIGDSPPSTAACIECSKVVCNSRACEKDETCGRRMFCAAPCVEAVCESRCAEKFPSAIYEIYHRCMLDKCLGACGL